MEISRWLDFKCRLPGKLNFWFWHCLFNALPSYVIAVKWLKLWDKPYAQLGMFCAVGVFILGYASVTSFFRFLSDEKTIFARSLRVGLWMRLVVSGLTLILATDKEQMFFSPDVWCGFLASGITSYVFRYVGVEEGYPGGFHFGEGGAASDSFFLFGNVFITTVLQGLLLSFGLFLMSFLALLFLQILDRKGRWRGCEETW